MNIDREKLEWMAGEYDKLAAAAGPEGADAGFRTCYRKAYELLAAELRALADARSQEAQ